MGEKMQEPEKDKSAVKQTLEPEPLFPLKGYLILNGIFWAYCLIQLLVLLWLFRDIVGLIFFFVVLGVGFTLVSIYDYTYDRIAYKKSLKKEEKNKKDEKE
jgi:type III secretory pathway component EscU